MSRMSSRERLERKAAEAEVAAKEKTERKATPTPTRSSSRKSAVASVVRQKVVWKVFNAGFKEVAEFPHPKKAEADALAAKLTTESGTSHFVNAAKVPMEDA
ncbi:MAG: hypothetical protein U1E76_00440 [Planctomycetota bacterium]